MTDAISPDLFEDLVAAASDPHFDQWLAMVQATGGCAEPIHLWGESRTVHTGTGELLASREPGRLLVACGNRRRARCPSCSEIYRADTFQMIKAGLVGGKNVPESVTAHPKVFATFTAPGFGPVHHHVVSVRGQRRRCHPHGPVACHRRHSLDDPRLGQPLDPDSYDYVGAVIWNALSTRLWARTTQLINRSVAKMLGINQRTWPSQGRVSVAKVAEYQARGLVHFHAIFRIDGADVGDAPPAGATEELLCRAIHEARSNAEVKAPACPALAASTRVGWGDQLDLRPVSSKNGGESTLSDEQVAGYLAKYATKGAEASGTVDRPLACRSCQGLGQLQKGNRQHPCDRCSGSGSRDDVWALSLPSHVQVMIATCWELGGIPELEGLRLRPWAHMLGFRGHFSTKSRRYSTTLSSLRGARSHWRSTRTLVVRGIDPTTPVQRRNVADIDDLGDLVGSEDQVLVVGHWQYTGRGHSPGQAIYAATVAGDLAEGRRIWRQVQREST